MDTATCAKTLLIVEDNSDDMFFIGRILKKAGLKDKAAFMADGEEAIRYLERSLVAEGPLPSVMLLDLNLPRVNGFELMAWVRAQRRLDNLLLAVMASSSYDRDVQRAFDAGAMAYLLKYPAVDDIQSLVQRAALVAVGDTQARGKLPGLRPIPPSRESRPAQTP